MKIDASKIGLGEQEVVPTGKVYRRCLEAQLGFAKVGRDADRIKDGDDDSVVTALESQLGLLNQYTDFLGDVFKLTKKKREALEDEKFTDLTAVVNDVAAKVLGYDSSKDTKSKSGQGSN